MVFWSFWNFVFILYSLPLCIFEPPFLQSLEVGFSFSCIILLHGWYCMARLFYTRLHGVVGHVSFRREKQATRGLEL